MSVSTALLYCAQESDPETALQEEQLRERLLAVARPGIGYRMARALILPDWEAEFGPLNTKRVYRVWKECRLLCPRKSKKRRSGQSVPLAATKIDEVWCLDFVFDWCLNGTLLKILALKDEYTRECLALEVAISLNSFDVRRVVQRVIQERGAPQFLRSDNGPEFIARQLGIWLQTQGTQTRFIKPGSPWQNGHAESFMARLRAECLDAEVFHNLADAQLKLEVFRRYYNQVRPHSALGYIPPAQFAQRLKEQSK
jgi:transposase InsO family protein